MYIKTADGSSVIAIDSIVRLHATSTGHIVADCTNGETYTLARYRDAESADAGLERLTTEITECLQESMEEGHGLVIELLAH